MAELPDGSLLAGGDFQLAGTTFAGRLARWDGSAWGPFASSFQPNGTVAAPAGGVATAQLPISDLLGGPQAVTSSNGLLLQIGQI